MPPLPALDTRISTPPPLPVFDGTSPLSPWLSAARSLAAAHRAHFLSEVAAVEHLARSLRARPAAWYAYHRSLVYLTSVDAFLAQLAYHFDVGARVPSSDGARRLALDFLRCTQGQGGAEGVAEGVAAYTARFQELRKAYAKVHLAALERHYGTRAGQRELLAHWYRAGLREDVRDAVRALCPDAAKVSDVEAAALSAEARLAGRAPGGASGAPHRQTPRQEHAETRHVSYEQGLGAGGRALRLSTGPRGMPGAGCARAKRA